MINIWPLFCLTVLKKDRFSPLFLHISCFSMTDTQSKIYNHLKIGYNIIFLE